MREKNEGSYVNGHWWFWLKEVVVSRLNDAENRTRRSDIYNFHGPTIRIL